MIYLVTKQTQLFNSEYYKIMSIDDALSELKDWKHIQFDTETSGREPHLCKLLCAQFGNDERDIRIVVDCESYSITLFKDILESKLLIGHNLKFDISFLYSYGIIPRKVYDTMIVEQLLYLGYPPFGTLGGISYALNAVALRRLGVNIDKTVRGEIIWRGLDSTVVLYAAGDVTYLEQIAKLQVNECREKRCLEGAKLENDFIPSIAYMEWGGILLDENKWKEKMVNDQNNLMSRKKALDDFIVSNNLSDYYYIDAQGDLFTGFNTDPIVTINWSSSRQVVEVAKHLGFNTVVRNKKTGESSESVLEKNLKTQRGINDKFLKLYFDYKESEKVVSSFGQGHLDAINPITGRLHTTFKQLGAASGRLSCGSSQSNTDLANYKHLNPSRCKYPNLQQLPSDEATRSAFVAPENYRFVSADFSAEESRLAADIYKDKAFYDEFVHRSGDTHSMFAWVVFRNECEALGCKSVADVKEKAPQWRKAVKAVEFAYLFGAAAPTISQSADCSVEQAQQYIDAMDKEFSGVSSFAKKGSQFVRKNGYIIINPITGHRLNWWDFEDWKKDQELFNEDGFWDDYKLHHKGTGDSIAEKVRTHFQAASKYDRLARNVVTQGTGACIMKQSMTDLFNWIVDNGYFGKIHICASVHDEICCDYPQEVIDFPRILEKTMENAAAKFCKSLPIPAEAAVGDHWIH